MNWSRALWAWGLIVAVEMVHGILREIFITPVLGDRPARQVGVLVGSGLILMVAVLTIRWIGAKRTGEQLRVGGAWVVLIVVFEVALGLALGFPAERIIEDYDLSAGGFMGLGLVLLFLAPALAHRMRRAGWRAHLPVATAFVLAASILFVVLVQQRDVASQARHFNHLGWSDSGNNGAATASAEVRPPWRESVVNSSNSRPAARICALKSAS